MRFQRVQDYFLLSCTYLYINVYFTWSECCWRSRREGAPRIQPWFPLKFESVVGTLRTKRILAFAVHPRSFLAPSQDSSLLDSEDEEANDWARWLSGFFSCFPSKFFPAQSRGLKLSSSHADSDEQLLQKGWVGKDFLIFFFFFLEFEDPRGGILTQKKII